MTPPRLARALLQFLARPHQRQPMLDDLEEAFVRESATGPLRARLWYWRQVLLGIPALIGMRLPRRVGPGPLARGFVIDVRYALRSLARTPGFTTVAVVSLAFGIGASTSLYGAIRVALLDTLGVDRASELRLLYWAGPDPLRVSQYNSGGYRDPATQRQFRTNVSHLTLRALIARDSASVFGFNFRPGLIVEGDGVAPVPASGLLVSGNAFGVLRPVVALGRGIIPSDDEPAAARVAVLSQRFWRSAFGGDVSVVGRSIRINNAPFVVVGVMAEEFAGLSMAGRQTPLADVIAPVAAQPQLWSAVSEEIAEQGRQTHVLWLRVMMRVPPGSVESDYAATTTRALAASLQETGVTTEAEAREVRVMLRSGARGVDSISGVADKPLRVLGAVVGAVVLIACVNLAALLLARGVARQRELAVRQALGAGRGRLVRQLLAESLTLAALGGAAGMALALVARPFVASMLQAGLGTEAATLPLDWRTLAVAAGVTGGAAILFGLMPALRMTSGGLVTRLRQHMIGASAPRLLLGRVLLALQIAVSVPLIVASLLLLRTLHNLDRVDTGFNPRGLVMFRLDPAHALAGASGRRGPVSPEAAKALASRLLQRLEAAPGVVSATLVENPLLSGFYSNNLAVINGREVPMHMNGVGPRFFETLGMPLVAGRAPALDDDDVVVVNQEASRRYFGGSPIGKRFRAGRRDVEIVGVAADAKYDGVRSGVEPTIFDPYMQRAFNRELNIVVRATTRGRPLEAELRRAVADIAPSTPIVGMRTQSEQIALLAGRERLLARLLTLFGTFALVLACIGLYGATAYSVARRTSEIGLRVALGATREHVLWMILRSVFVLTAAGLAVGAAVSTISGRLLQSLLFELEPTDPLTIAAAAAIMFAVSLAAGALPARRAARIEPLIALRRD